MEKILELAKKLKALAEQGVGGEKTNAIEALAKLLAKHDISPEELEDPIRTTHNIYVAFKQRDIFAQVFRKVFGNKVDMYNLRRSKNTYVQELSAAEYLELMATFEFYWTAYERDFEIFQRAFIQKNRLFDSEAPSKDIDELTEEEQDKARKMFALAESMEKHEMRKQIEA